MGERPTTIVHQLVNVGLIPRSSLGQERLLRLDAEYVTPVFRERETQLRSYPGWQIATVCELGHAAKALCSGDDSIKYVAIDDVDRGDGLIYAATMLLGDLPSRAKYIIQPKDVLVSNVRPNRGTVAISAGRDVGSIASSGYTLLRMRSDADIAPEFLFAYLKSVWGRIQLVRRDRGSMYPAVLAEDVLEVWIPKPTAELEGRIVKRVIDALEAQTRFFDLVKKQEDMLAGFLEPYGAPPSPLEAEPGALCLSRINHSGVFGMTCPRRHPRT